MFLACAATPCAPVAVVVVTCSQESAYLKKVIADLEGIRRERALGDPGDQQAAAFISLLLDQTDRKKHPGRGGVAGVIAPLFYELCDPNSTPIVTTRVS